VQPLDVLAEAEDRRSVLARIAADPLEDAGAVMEGVRRDVNARVSPWDELIK
jgi:hypothetical protein